MATDTSAVRRPKGRVGDATSPTEEDTGHGGAAPAAAEAIRDMIRRRELLPGEPVRQQDMATQLQVSRVPIREALHSLEKEGFLKYERNRGYFVAKLSAVELSQIHRMAQVLESLMMEDFEWPDQKQLKSLTTLNKQLGAAARAGQTAQLAILNREFHEAIWGLSALRLIEGEVRRLWDMADSYRALYLAGPSRLHIAEEHDGIIDALRRRDRKLLAKRLQEHRGRALHDVSPMLGV